MYIRLCLQRVLFAGLWGAEVAKLFGSPQTVKNDLKLGRLLEYLIFSLMALIGDPIY